MTSDARKSGLLSITVRPSAAEKVRFATLARLGGISESRLALAAIRAFLKEEGPGPHARLADRAPATDRITIRLRPGDGQAISRRAAQRGMKTSTYLAALARSHIAVNPPLTSDELAALKQSVRVLTDVRRLLAQIARTSAITLERGELVRTQAAVAALEERTEDLAKAALVSWESRV
jgi:hypothetical protein